MPSGAKLSGCEKSRWGKLKPMLPGESTSPVGMARSHANTDGSIPSTSLPTASPHSAVMPRAFTLPEPARARAEEARERTERQGRRR